MCAYVRTAWVVRAVAYLLSIDLSPSWSSWSMITMIIVIMNVIMIMIILLLLLVLLLLLLLMIPLSVYLSINRSISITVNHQSSQDYILNFNQWCIDLSISPMCLSVISPRTHRFHHWRCRTASVQGRPRWGCFESLERKWPGLTGRGMPWAETQRIFISKAQALMMPVSSHGMPMAQVQSSSCRKRGPSPCQSLA